MDILNCFSDNNIEFPSYLKNLFEPFELNYLQTVITDMGDALLDLDTCWAALNEYDGDRPIGFISELYQKMKTTNKFEPFILVGCYLHLTAEVDYRWESMSSNTIFKCNVIDKLVKLLNFDLFEWNLLIFVKEQSDFDKLIEALKEGYCKNDISLIFEYNINVDDYKYYKIAVSDPEFSESDFLNSADKSAYLKRLSLLYSDEIEELNLQDSIPLCVQSTLLVLHHLGLKIESLNHYKDKFSYKSFWNDAVGIHDVLFSKQQTTLTIQHLENLQRLTDLLMGSYDISNYGEEPIYNLLVSYARDYLQRSSIGAIKDSCSPPSKYRRYYFNVNNRIIKMFEYDAVYLWDSLKSFLDSVFNKPGFINADVKLRTLKDPHKKQDLKEVLFNFVYYDSRNIHYKFENTFFTDLNEFFVVLPLNKLLDLLENLYKIGAMVKCYNWNYLYMVYVLQRKGLPYTDWAKIYGVYPSAVDTFITEAFLALLLGCEDYKTVFQDINYGLPAMQYCCDSINRNYNFAMAAVIRLLQDLRVDYSKLPKSKTLLGKYTVIDKKGKETFELCDILNGTAYKRLIDYTGSVCYFSVTDNQLTLDFMDR